MKLIPKFRRREPYRIGLAMSGGGARGFAHAGAIKALLECGIRPDLVAGVSAGSVVAVMYAAGLTPEQMLRKFKEAKFRDFVELGMPTDGFFSLDRFREFLRKELAPYRTLEELPVKTVIGVTNLDLGRKVKFDHGQIDEVVAASCSIPIVFKPVHMGSARYVDGGVTANLPAWAIRPLCRYLIGINVSPLVHYPVKNNIMGIALRSYELMAKTNVLGDGERCDMLVNTEEIARYQVFNLKEIDRVFESGYRDTMNYLLYYGFKPQHGGCRSEASKRE